MGVFQFRQRIMGDCARFSRSFTRIQSADVDAFIDAAYQAETFWPAPLVRINPSFVPGRMLDELANRGVLDEECRRTFRAYKAPGDIGRAMRLHKDQEEAIHAAQRRGSYVLTTGTGSGKSLAYFIPIVDDVLRRRRAGNPCQGISAIVIYLMNMLCNSPLAELEKFLTYRYGIGHEPVRYARYTGPWMEQEPAHE